MAYRQDAPICDPTTSNAAQNSWQEMEVSILKKKKSNTIFPVPTGLGTIAFI